MVMLPRCMQCIITRMSKNTMQKFRYVLARLGKVNRSAYIAISLHVSKRRRCDESEPTNFFKTELRYRLG